LALCAHFLRFLHQIDVVAALWVDGQVQRCHAAGFVFVLGNQNF
jgi:hypothetical protein